ncbi:MAG: hypothetical protein AAF798_08075 [Bacteroidota bacterium]
MAGATLRSSLFTRPYGLAPIKSELLLHIAYTLGFFLFKINRFKRIKSPHAINYWAKLEAGQVYHFYNHGVGRDNLFSAYRFATNFIL